jgi:hypothetical protein
VSANPGREVRLTESKALGNIKVKSWDVDSVLNRGENVIRGFTAHDRT